MMARWGSEPGARRWSSADRWEGSSPLFSCGALVGMLALTSASERSCPVAGRASSRMANCSMSSNAQASRALRRRWAFGSPGGAVFGRDGALIGERPLDQVLTSWGHLYGLLRKALADDVYHHGCDLERVEETGESVVAHFADGSKREADLLIGADGIFST